MKFLWLIPLTLLCGGCFEAASQRSRLVVSSEEVDYTNPGVVAYKILGTRHGFDGLPKTLLLLTISSESRLPEVSGSHAAYVTTIAIQYEDVRLLVFWDRNLDQLTVGDSIVSIPRCRGVDLRVLRTEEGRKITILER